jgi:hypothetical protein
MLPARHRQSDQLADVAAALSPGMARVLERLVTAYISGTQPHFTAGDNALLVAAGLALGTVNRTPGAAEQIGREAAYSISLSPYAKNLLSVGQAVQKQLRALPSPPRLKLGGPR